MPVAKIPLIQKFGIISSSHRFEIQERLLRQVELLHQSNYSSHQRNLLEVTEEFVYQFNTAVNLKQKEKCEEKARKLLEKAKRLAGLKNCGNGDHVNLPVAWTQLAQLAQCKGRIQEKCLKALKTSLAASPLEKNHVPALFFLAESMLYWLQTEEIQYPYLTTREIAILKISQLVFERLYYHHMTGEVHEHLHSKQKLSLYMNGFRDLEVAYDLYPEAIWCLRFVLESGRILLSDLQQDPACTERDPKDVLQMDLNLANVHLSDVCQTDVHQTDIGQTKMSRTESEQTDVHQIDVHPFLDHQPEPTTTDTHGLSEESKDMYKYYSHEEHGFVQGQTISSSVHELSPTLWHALDVFRFISGLGGDCQGALASRRHCGLGFGSETWVDSMVAIHVLGESAKINLAAVELYIRLAEGGLLCTCDTCTGLSRTSAGSKPLASEASGVILHGHDKKKGITEWPWEVAAAYINVLEQTVLSGSTTTIQKLALTGCAVNCDHQSPHKTAGLAGLVKIGLGKEVPITELATKNHIWRVRCLAIQSLGNICHKLKGEKTRELIHSFAWRILQQANSKEKDLRVVEALRVNQTHTDKQEDFPGSSVLQSGNPVHLFFHIAKGLTAVYLPPIRPPSTPGTPRVKIAVRPALPQSPAGKPALCQPVRTLLRQELQLASGLGQEVPDYNTRTSFDLRRIVEDQWRKELQVKLKEEESNKFTEILQQNKNLAQIHEE